MGEISRRLVHASGVVIPLTYLADLLNWQQIRVLLVICLATTLVLEAIRLGPGLEWRIYDHLTRPYEADNPAGYALYMVGITAIGLAFAPAIAIPGMLMLMLGDPISGHLGRGELRQFKRPIAIVGMFLVSVVVTLPFALEALGGRPATALVATAVAGVAGTAADAVKPRVWTYVIDDNITIPIAGSVSLFIAVHLLG